MFTEQQTRGRRGQKRGAVLGEKCSRGTSDCRNVHRFASQTEERARVSCVVTGGSRHDRRHQGDGGDGKGGRGGGLGRARF